MRVRLPGDGRGRFARCLRPQILNGLPYRAAM
ncbi:hypothetical protein H4W34_005656 [Actinomadura algeriensis]|uniref:Uncharacterized protein n=1 Tax=Actinomadura algeriensis TaxID=1679523 RepID=A0ABR9JZ29_9ACTN|nr:hypothetical protein [Actinomadura algeriensis]